MKRFANKISFIIISFFMFAIIISFALTGFQGFDSSVDVVAKVDGTPIKYNEFQRVLNSKIDNYSRIFGGKSMSAQQIRQFRLKEATLKELIDQKLIYNLANAMTLSSSQKEIKTLIKEIPDFQTNNRFDVNKYRGLLNANRLTPSAFEEDIMKNIKLRKVVPLFTGLTVSNDFAKDMLKFKNNSATTTAIQFDKSSLNKHIQISASKISEFLKDEKNKVILESLYKSKSNLYNIPEKVKASHILFKLDGKNEKEVLLQAQKIRKTLNNKNFAQIANKQTQDASGKGKGGSLGWFEKGRMVPEFENVAFSMQPGSISAPIKTQFGYHIIYVQEKKAAENKSLESVKKELAKEHLQISSADELKKVVQNVTDQVKSLLQENNFKSLESLKAKYGLTLESKKELNVYDLRVGTISIEKEDVLNIFTKRENDKIISKDTGARVIIAKIHNFKDEKSVKSEIEKSLDSELSAQNQRVNDSFYQKLVENLQKKANIVTYPKML